MVPLNHIHRLLPDSLEMEINDFLSWARDPIHFKSKKTVLSDNRAEINHFQRGARLWLSHQMSGSATLKTVLSSGLERRSWTAMRACCRYSLVVCQHAAKSESATPMPTSALPHLPISSFTHQRSSGDHLTHPRRAVG